MEKLGREETQNLLQTVQESFSHDLCYSCECFLAYLAQLRLDANTEDRDLFVPFKVSREQMHKCLGCVPCPPGDLYAAYMQKKRDSRMP